MQQRFTWNPKNIRSSSSGRPFRVWEREKFLKGCKQNCLKKTYLAPTSPPLENKLWHTNFQRIYIYTYKIQEKQYEYKYCLKRFCLYSFKNVSSSRIWCGPLWWRTPCSFGIPYNFFIKFVYIYIQSNLVSTPLSQTVKNDVLSGVAS